MIGRRHLFKLLGAVGISAALPKVAEADETFCLPDLRLVIDTQVGRIVLNYAILSRTIENESFILQPGMIYPVDGNVAPPGWLLCTGRAVSRRTYPELFKAIGHTYG